MEHRPLRILTPDGRSLGADLYTPARATRAQVIIHGATAVRRSHYAPFARFLASQGYQSLVYDYRGVGDSGLDHARHDSATMSEWFEQDAPAAVLALRALNPSVPLFAVGHSFGGQIAAALADVPQPEALVTMGAQRGYWAAFPWRARPRLALTWFVVLPAVIRTLGYVPAWAGLGMDMPAGVIGEWARWCARPEYFLGDHPALAQRMARFTGPLLALSVTDDAFAPLENVEWLLGLHSNAQVEHVRFEPVDVGARRFGHFGFFRESYEPTVWQDVVGHFDETLGARREARRVLPVAASNGAPARGMADRELMLDLEYGRF